MGYDPKVVPKLTKAVSNLCSPTTLDVPADPAVQPRFSQGAQQTLLLYVGFVNALRDKIL